MKFLSTFNQETEKPKTMKITAYKTAWNASDNVGSFRFLMQNNQWTEWIDFDNIQDYQVVLALLQNEKPVYYRVHNGKDYYYTDQEATGIQG